MSPSAVLPFDLVTEEFDIGPRQLRLWRPSRPQELDDPEAEHGAAGPVWAQTWTSGAVLARTVARWPLTDICALELGCGLGLVGIAAASAGARTTVSDRSARALALASANAERNGVSVDAVQCDWAHPAALEALAPWDVILGADVLYDELSAHHLLALLGRLIAADGEVWLADPGREVASAFLVAASMEWRVSTSACGHGVRMHRLTPSASAP